MISLIKNLQRKPESFRKKFSFFFSAGFALLIVFFWLVGIFSSSGGTGAEEITVEEAVSPFTSIKSSFGATAGQIKSLIGGFKEKEIPVEKP